MGKKKATIETPTLGKCMRCHNKMDKSLRTKPWCVDCEAELKAMKFDGEQVLDMVVAMMPPAPPHDQIQVKVWTVLRIARGVLLEKLLLLPADEEPHEPSKPAVLLGK